MSILLSLLSEVINKTTWEGDCVVMQQFNSSVSVKASLVRAIVCARTTLLLIQLPSNMPGRAVVNGSITCVPTTPVGYLDRVPGSGFSLVLP